MNFIDSKHEEFYNEKLEEFKRHGGMVDGYSRSLFYLLGLSADTRRNFHSMFNMKERGIIPEALNQGWQTGTSMKITRLAFNLWNGFVYDDPFKEEVSRYYSPDEIFCCNLAPYFFEAIRLRYPQYT